MFAYQQRFLFRILGAQLNDWMCRLDDIRCLKAASTYFGDFLSNCYHSYHGTAHCTELVAYSLRTSAIRLDYAVFSFFRVIPDYRRTMYCYGLKQNPKTDSVILSLYKYFPENAAYFERDGDNLLNALSCNQNVNKLEQ
ncbi:hypothetical protein Y032_0960g3219 [Ancylostoma ceylanicum]|uniref:Uncharacterized protein n=1 Tax=Ancylostoma ceylanicum TaxID=53326 RepID=A0A016W7S5_9BILA|nr:hypothetical protein Y032_0960g3219 [Ancylostoma ceylanicum]